MFCAVIRFTREEILQLRKPSKPLPELEKLGDIIFPGQQDPECFKQLDADEVYRLWHAAPESKGRAADAGRGRGRGRGKTIGLYLCAICIINHLMRSLFLTRWGGTRRVVSRSCSEGDGQLGRHRSRWKSRQWTGPGGLFCRHPQVPH